MICLNFIKKGEPMALLFRFLFLCQLLQQRRLARHVGVKLLQLLLRWWKSPWMRTF